MDRLCNKYLNSSNFNKVIDRDLRTEIAKEASNGNPDALAAYSVMQLKGYGVEKNELQAKERLRAYAKSGEPYGKFLCGVLASDPYFEFSGDLFLSESYLRSIVFGNNKDKLSSDKIGVSASILGDYYSGKYPEFVPDKMESLRAYEKAAECGDLNAMVKVGCMLINGVEGLFDDSIEANESRGVEFLLNAKLKGSEVAVRELLKFHLRKALELGKYVGDSDENMGVILNTISTIEWRL
ncbi:hypothetical protein [Photobacterium damselae]|uniref:hypothetical protein n=1 Tax=Photobacterium damselae TaxID=38293 RepID=UPI004068C70F